MCPSGIMRNCNLSFMNETFISIDQNMTRRIYRGIKSSTQLKVEKYIDIV